MEYKATSKYIRTAPRKLRLIADAIRPLTPLEALVQLENMPKAAAQPMRKTLLSVLANAKAKQTKEESLHFTRIEVMGGPVMKRWHAVSRGQAHAFKKRMTNICIVLSDAEGKKE